MLPKFRPMVPRLIAMRFGITMGSLVLLAILIVSCAGGGGSSPAAVGPQQVVPTPTPHPTPTPSGPADCTTSKAVRYAHAMARLMEAARIPARRLMTARVGRGPASRVCPDQAVGRMSCRSWVRTDLSPRLPMGYGPNELQSAYNLTSASSSKGVGQVVAIVDAFDDVNAESDLTFYRSAAGLPACTTANGCFIKVNQIGIASNYPSGNGGWALEESLDLDMVSAVCPKCDIILVEANTNNNSDLYTAEDTAATTCGANVISNSWGGGEYPSETSDELHFNRPGIMITFASGDNQAQASYPPASQYVTSVGGTTLNLGPYSETVWPDSGSWCSQYIAQPSWQALLGSSYTSVCSGRMYNDVAAVADPGTPVAVYDTAPGGCGGWCGVGGTSAATPIIAGVYALAENEGSITSGSYSYSHAGSLNAITMGNNGPETPTPPTPTPPGTPPPNGCPPYTGTFICNAGPGYNGPAGNGSPNGIGGF